MATSDELLHQLIESLAAEGCATGLDEFEVESVTRIGRMRIARDKAIRDMEAARLLPLGREVAASRLGVAPSTVYKMMHRHNRSTVKQPA
jgi:hypothetical protein